VTLRAASDSVLAVGVLHQIFDASNNNGALVDSLLDGADAGNMTQLAAALLTVLSSPRGCSGDVPAHSPNGTFRIQTHNLRLGNDGRRGYDRGPRPVGTFVEMVRDGADGCWCVDGGRDTAAPES
jgi:hypothetical protein